MTAEQRFYEILSENIPNLTHDEYMKAALQVVSRILPDEIPRVDDVLARLELVIISNRGRNEK